MLELLGMALEHEPLVQEIYTSLATTDGRSRRQFIGT